MDQHYNTLLYRVESLENLIFGTTSDTDINNQMEQFELDPLDSEIRNSISNWNQLLNKKKLLFRFFESYEKIKPMVEEKKELVEKEKLEVISCSSQQIKQGAQLIHQILQKEAFLNSENYDLQRLREYQTELELLQTKFSTNLGHSKENHLTLVQLLEDYNKLISAVSQESYNFHLLISQLEK